VSRPLVRIFAPLMRPAAGLRHDQSWAAGGF
jgi:hypothetical protein